MVATAIVGVQLVVWTVTGLAFTLFDFDAMRGTNDRAPPAELDLRRVRVRPEDAANAARASCASAIRAVAIRALDDRVVYGVACDAAKAVLIDAESAAVSTIDEARAARIATKAFRGGTRIRSVERRKADGEDVFVVHLDDPRATDVSVNAATGEITAWQNRSYRRFDWLWSAHVLGYVDRRNPAN